MRCPVCHRRLGRLSPCPLHQVSAAAPADSPPPLPPALAGFSEFALLGSGGFAHVFSARRESGGEVAVKLLQPGAGERLAREVEALGRLGPPVTPALLGQGMTGGGQHYLVLELLRGETLAARMAALPGSGALPLAEALALIEPLCRAVAAMHQADIIHRDLKPENIFLAEGGRVALLDFGLSRDAGGLEPAASARITRTGERLGTPHYIAPEQCLEAAEIDARADLYSLGVVCYELLAGRPPFVGDGPTLMQEHVARRPPPASSFQPVPPEIDAALLKALAKEPSHRFVGAGELLAALERAPATSGVPSAPPAPSAVVARPRLVRRRIALLGVKTQAPVTEVERALPTGKAVLARVDPGRYLFAFPHEPTPAQGLAAARRGAQALADVLPAADRLMVHLADLAVRAGGPAGAQLFGASVDRPEAWWVASGERISLTPEAASSAEQLPSDGPDSSPDEASDFVGRESLLVALAADAQAAMAGRSPRLSTIIGEAGLGKTRLLAELARVLERAVGARVVRLTAPPPERAEPEALLGSLLRLGLGLAPLGPVSREAVRAACMALEPETPAAWVAAAVMLEALAEDDPAVRPLQAAGSLRPLAAKVAGAGLKRAAEPSGLVLLLDDAHSADPTSLDALEIAALSEHPAPLWLCVTARGTLHGLRPSWGDRAARSTTHELAPLATAEARALLRQLLHPVEFVPETLVARLAELAQGAPLELVELVRALKLGGALRKQAGSDAWYVAADELVAVSTTPLAERVARRAVESLEPALGSLLELAAVLGNDVSVAVLEATRESLMRLGEDPALDFSLDAGVGVARLARIGLLRRVGDGRYAFRHPMVREALESMISEASRRRCHQAAHGYLSTRPEGEVELERLARHAHAAGEGNAAFTAFMRLAERASREHRYVDADQYYGAALAELDGGADDQPARRRLVLAGRGRVRYRVQRFSESRADLCAAREIAEREGDTKQVARLLFDEAWVLDWLEEDAESAALVEHALELARPLADRSLQAHGDLAYGRVLGRRERWQEAAELLSRAATSAADLDDYEARVRALVALGFALVRMDRLDEAERRFDEVMTLCRAAGDRFHLAAVYINRALLWNQRQLPARALEDLRETVPLARELGYPQLERFQSFNLAEVLHWHGLDAEALPLARRAHQLGRRFFADHPVSREALLLARICCALGRFEEAREHAEWIGRYCQAESRTPAVLTLLALVDRLLAERGAGAGADFVRASWSQLVAEAELTCPANERLEVLFAAVSAALAANSPSDAARWFAAAQAGVEQSPLWRERLAELAPRLPIRHSSAKPD